MNSLLWFVQLLLAGIFLFDGFRKIFVHNRRKMATEPSSDLQQSDAPFWFAAAVGVCEIAGALGLVSPGNLWPPNILLRIAAGGLALLMVILSIYRGVHKQAPAPAMTLCFTALYVMVGRWP
jgi:uncharacterized membrane protein YphA (DoxX/SURF4 family)